ncbi:MAG TPA: hypothetical protein VKR24_04320 [Candidatus Limnocylindrales bacterium]|nr:hypothetical protein [Candidatus Limnocylindrales bacterium]
MIRFARAFLHFWSDFLIGDRLELFVGPIVVLLAAGALLGAGVDGALVGILFFAAIGLVGALSIGLATRR